MARRKHEKLRERSPEFRKGEHIEVLKSFLIACEGKCTEPNYINGLVKYHKFQHLIADGTKVIIAKHQHSDPCGVITDLITMPNWQDYDEKWIVIDRDEVEFKGKGFGGHTQENFDNAIKSASENGISVACSNPCFELWIVLHFEYLQSVTSRDYVQTKAKDLLNSVLGKNNQIKKIDGMKALKDLYLILKDKTDIARKYAEKLEENEKIKANPSTGVYRLLDAILPKSINFKCNDILHTKIR